MLCNRAGYQNHAPEQWAGRVQFFVSRWPLPGDFRRYPTQVLIPTQYICKNPNPQLGQIMEFELKDFVIMGLQWRDRSGCCRHLHENREEELNRNTERVLAGHFFSNSAPSAALVRLKINWRLPLDGSKSVREVLPSLTFRKG